jgi:hypothetical protein
MLNHGLDSSAELTDLFMRVALVSAWVCALILVYSLIDEIVYQLRTGMPSVRRRRLGGLGPIGRRMASAIIAVLPLSMTATPALIGAAPARHAVAAVASPVSATPRHARVTEGWSLVEVKRGDSLWSIAERVANGRDIAEVADVIVRANLGGEMADGQRFSTPALIEPGWVLSVPFTVDDEHEYTVEPGDSYWRIAEHHLPDEASNAQIAEYTHVLMDINAPRLGYRDAKLIRPGDVVLLDAPGAPASAPIEVIAEPVQDAPASPSQQPTTTTVVPVPASVEPTIAPATAPSTASPTSSPPSTTAVRGPDDGLPLSSGLAAATVLAGSVLAALAVRRRDVVRSAPLGARLRAPAPVATACERALRSVADLDAMARLDVALRAAAPQIVAAQARVVAAEISDDGAITVFTDHAVTLELPWLIDSLLGAWRLPAAAPLDEIALSARLSGQPCPAIVELGQTSTGRLFVDVEAVGVLAVDAPSPIGEAIVRALVAELALSPLGEPSRVFAVGVEEECSLGSAVVESVDSLDAAIDAVRASAASVVAATAATSTFALRCAGRDGEAWEPSLLLAATSTAHESMLVDAAVGGSRGIGIVVAGAVAAAGATLRQMDDGFVLEPIGRPVRPVGVTSSEVRAMSELLADPALELAASPSATIVSAPAAPESSLRVSLFGRVEVRSGDGVQVRFERAKALELVVWLSLHRVHPTRGSARAALWEIDVRDSTFSNVVSDARRAMARVVAPPDGEEWIGRTMTDDLPLHALIGSDADALEWAVNAARMREADEAIELLRPAVAMIEGLPFAGTSYLWPDAEGITSALILTATSAAAMLAMHYLDAGDIDGVFWATGQGLKVLSGHEELIALRMRAHAQRGDHAGVRSEWESYERTILADSWAGAEPSPKLVALRRELLAPSMAH